MLESGEPVGCESENPIRCGECKYLDGMQNTQREVDGMKDVHAVRGLEAKGMLDVIITSRSDLVLPVSVNLVGHRSCRVNVRGDGNRA